ncbi:MAG: response regulator [Candidatus Gastranaerophilales bacterium]|nr:response regulator [Candidatus Gastranaerophilales bacterium]
MFLETISPVISIIGILIPLAGMIALFQKEQQSRVSTFLMFTNVGCLIMNCGYLLVHKTRGFENVSVALSLEYLGNVLFYFFFVLFLVSYLQMRYMKGIIFVWSFIQGVELVFMGIEDWGRQDMGRVFFRVQEDIGIYSIKMETGIIHMIRYGFTCLLLLYALIYTVVCIVRTQIQLEKSNLIRLAMAQCVVMISLILMMSFNFSYDVVPILSSLSILSIVLSIIRGDFFSITDMGHEWVFRQMEDAFVIVDSMYGYLDANAYAKKVFPALNKMSKNKRIPEELYEIFMEENSEKEIEGRHYERKIMPLEQEGTVIGYGLLLIDITGQYQLVEELKIEKKKADEANRAKSEFLSIMSHDIRTPMNAIVGFATLMEKDVEKADKVRDYTRKIMFSSQHLLNLINDILDMSRIESGKTTLNEEEFSLPELLEVLYAMMHPQAKAKKQKFELRTAGRLPELVIGDKLRLNQVLINLLSNAVKYTQEGGRIQVRVEFVEQTAPDLVRMRFVVQDNGFGMSEGFVKTIFEPFSRETTASTKEIQGTGLGMAITKNIVDLMGGQLSLQSKLEEGSTFSVELEMKVAGRIASEETFWKDHNIARMLVAGEEEICLDIQAQMKEMGVSVSYVTDSGGAVEQASSEYQLILLDLDILGREGAEAAKQIQAKTTPNVPIIGLAAYDFTDWEEETASVRLRLTKPFFVSSLRRAVSQLWDDEADETAVSSKQTIELSGLKVLVAEDNEINQEVLMELMKVEGVECDIVSNGQEVLDKFLAAAPGRYDLIFMDVHMPVMDGYAAARAIRASSHKEAATIPIIAMTADAFDEDVRKALEAGMNAHTAKPIDMDKLKATIADLQV